MSVPAGSTEKSGAEELLANTRYVGSVPTGKQVDLAAQSGHHPVLRGADSTSPHGDDHVADGQRGEQTAQGRRLAAFCPAEILSHPRCSAGADRCPAAPPAEGNPFRDVANARPLEDP